MTLESSLLICGGWGQPIDSLLTIHHNHRNIWSYMNHPSYQEALSHIPCKDVNIAIGWSLGGQLLLRAAEDRALSCRTLILISTPYCFIDNTHISQEMFTDFTNRLNSNSPALLKRFQTLISKGHSQPTSIMKQLGTLAKTSYTHLNYWLDQLGTFSCSQLNLSNHQYDDVHVIHGMQDHVVSVCQSQQIINLFPQAKLHTLESCGHAPHIECPNLFKSFI